ncbi:MAG TPA: cupredoxin domain-containing protein [Actinomycetota bacterium]|nr:cupredoxin domain-containing protein [Actinomycetota bacterium]
MRPTTVRSATSFATILLLILAVGACSGDSDGGGSETSETDAEVGDLAPGSAAVNIVDLTFEPTTITVAAGSTDIAITNADSTDHTFTLDDDTVNQPVAAGEKVTVTVDLSSSVGFHCEIHPSMTGTLQVA